MKNQKTCNRSACGVPSTPEIPHMIHTQSGEYYCVCCARRINEWNPGLVVAAQGLTETRLEEMRKREY